MWIRGWTLSEGEHANNYSMDFAARVNEGVLQSLGHADREDLQGG
jgi:hypothetical protein